MSPAILPFEGMLRAAWKRSDDLFAKLTPQEFLERPISLRHPFLFYLGHLPAFAWNQIGRGVLDNGHLNSEFDLLFERGIDPDSEVSAKEVSRQVWPSLDETLAYRDEVRKAVLCNLQNVLSVESDPMCEKGRILHLVVEHELMHHETLLYMFQERTHFPKKGSQSDFIGGEGKVAERRRVPRGKVTLGTALERVDFVWDNELGHMETNVPAFIIDSLPVRNGDYAAFLERLGEAERRQFIPRSWGRFEGQACVKTALGPASMAVASGWPVQVSVEQARGYASFRGGRLPTEAEIRRAAFGTPSGADRTYPWGDSAPTKEHGNFGFAHFAPVPTGHYPKGASAFGVEELVGNGWELTSTPFAPFPGFAAYARTYPGYSTDFFDDAHFVVLGASFATDEKLLRPTFRNWYRGDYPYPFSSFRVVYDAKSPINSSAAR